MATDLNEFEASVNNFFNPKPPSPSSSPENQTNQTPAPKKKIGPKAAFLISVFILIAAAYAGYIFIQDEQYGSITVSTVPDNASIKINGKLISNSGEVTLGNLGVGEPHTLEVEAAGFTKWISTFSLAGSETEKLNIILGPLGQDQEKLAKAEINIKAVDEETGQSIKGARVFFGEREMRTTPATFKDVEIDTEYKMRVSRKGYQDIEETLFFNAEDEKKVTLALTPLLQAPPMAAKGKIKIAAIDVKTGERLRAQAYLDGKKIGTTPVTVALDKKRHLIKLSSPGYRQSEKKVSGKPNQTQKISFSMTPSSMRGKLSIEAKDRLTGKKVQASVFVNGIKKGKTPIELSDLDREVRHTIKLSSKGYVDVDELVVFDLNKSHDISRGISAEMQPKGGRILILSKESNQPFDIFLDNQYIGKFFKKELAGLRLGHEYQIVARKPGYEDFTKEIVLSDEQPVEVMVTSISSSLPCSQPCPPSIDVVKPKLEITSNVPHVEIFLDGRSYGTIRKRGEVKTISDLTPGKFQMEGKLLGHSKDSKHVTLESGKTKRTNLNMKRVQGKLFVETDPPGAMVHVNGVLKGKAPISLSLSENRKVKLFNIKVSLSGYREDRVVLDLSNDPGKNYYHFHMVLDEAKKILLAGLKAEKKLAPLIRKSIISPSSKTGKKINHFFRTAVASYENALKLDSSYSMAYSSLARVYLQYISYIKSKNPISLKELREAVLKVKRYTEEVISLDNDTLAYAMALVYRGDALGVEGDFRKGLQKRIRNFDDAIESYDKATEAYYMAREKKDFKMAYLDDVYFNRALTFEKKEEVYKKEKKRTPAGYREATCQAWRDYDYPDIVNIDNPFEPTVNKLRANAAQNMKKACR